ncbi:MAG: ribonuclease P protein component [Actinomycetales bacterium]|nr:ribonuclease P protein component [Actinomycetales bacterium]
MLARENRLVTAEDFRSTMKMGRKVSSDNLVIYLKRDEAMPQSRFGFVVAKTVGGAVTRNLVKRRFRAIAREQLPELQKTGNSYAVVVRALPGSANCDWNKLQKELSDAISVAAKKAGA